MKLNDISKKTLNNNILILGKGYLGCQLSSYLTQLGHNLYVKSREELDYHNSKDLSHFLVDKTIDCVINCSGFTGRPNVDEAESKKALCWDLNVVIPQQIVQICNKLSIKCIHVSSGCIYSGYNKDYVEGDAPNFGLFDESSFYSKSKHAFETLSRDLDVKILRLRMPICENLDDPKNYLHKILKYPNLIDFLNSKTYLPDLFEFINKLLKNPDVCWDNKQDIYNVTNPNPLLTRGVVEILKKKFDIDPNWVDISDLDIVAPRSNCVLNSNKAYQIHQFMDESEFLHKIVEKYEKH